MDQPPPFRLICAGTRSFDDFALLCLHLDTLLVEKVATHRVIILSGGAAGADTLGEAFARKRDYGLEVFPANWERWGTRAGPIRNQQLVNAADAAVFFWDGRSHGTRDCLTKAKNKGIPVRVIRYDQQREPVEAGVLPPEIAENIGQ